MAPLSNLQVLRGMAASLVLLFHVWGELGDRRIPNSWPSMMFGAFGVDIFFAISGFIMVYASARSFGTRGAWAVFLRRRIIRVVPLYWLITTVYLAFMLATGQASDVTIPFVIASFLFIPYPSAADYFPVYSLGWTLQYEMFFYLCFSSVLALSRPKAVLALSLGFVGLFGLGQLVSLPWPLDFCSSSVVLEFVFGMVLAEVHLRGFRFSGWFASVLALGAFAAVLLATPSMDSWFSYRGLVWGLPGAALVAAAVFHRPEKTSAARRFLERLGDASYSLYLVHYLVMVVVARILRHALNRPERIPSFAYAGLLIGLAGGAAFLLYRYFERPVTRFLNERFVFDEPGPGRVAAFGAHGGGGPVRRAQGGQNSRASRMETPARPVEQPIVPAEAFEGEGGPNE